MRPIPTGGAAPLAWAPALPMPFGGPVEAFAGEALTSSGVPYVTVVHYLVTTPEGTATVTLERMPGKHLTRRYPQSPVSERIPLPTEPYLAFFESAHPGVRYPVTRVQFGPGAPDWTLYCSGSRLSWEFDGHSYTASGQVPRETPVALATAVPRGG